MARESRRPSRRTFLGIAAAMGLPGRSRAGPEAAPAGPPPDGASPIVSVLPRRSDVLASDAVGLVRADRADRVWRRLPSPGPLPALHVDEFVDAPDDAGGVLVYTRPANDGEAYPAPLEPGTGLFRSRDGGRSWEAVSTAYEFRSVFRHPGGDLYALVGPAAAGTFHKRLLASHDGGATWRDVTTNANALGVGSLTSVFADPDRPGLVCLNAQGKRAYVLQALQADDPRGLWRAETMTAWERRHATADAFLSPGLAYSAPDLSDFRLPATLANYFLHPFGSRTWLDALALTTDRPRYEFPGDGPKVVRAVLRFLPAGRPAALAVSERAGDTWGLRVVGPAGRRASVPSASEEAVVGGTDGDRRRLEERAALRRGGVGAGRPYERDVDLAALFAFDAPGAYRVQLRYANPLGPSADDRRAWVGVVAGEPFTVVVR